VSYLVSLLAVAALAAVLLLSRQAMRFSRRRRDARHIVLVIRDAFWLRRQAR